MSIAPHATGETTLGIPAMAGGGPPSASTVRVLHVVDGEHYAGAERVQDLLALNLGQLGFEVGFACIKPGRFSRLRQARRAPLYELRMRSAWDLSCVRNLVRLARDQGYALLHTHTPPAALVGSVAATLARIPVVHHVHGPMAADSTRLLRNWINAATQRVSLARSDAVIATSQAMAAYARRMAFDPSRISVVPSGVAARGPLAARQRPVGEWTLGMVALHRPCKGMEVLLEAVAALRSQGCLVRLRVVGAFENPAYQTDVRDLAARLGLGDAIDWQGFVADVNDELARMDLLIVPSLRGGRVSTAVLEAMAAGVPVVASRVAGVTEAIRDGIDGLTVPPADPQPLAAAVRLVLEDKVDWHALRANAHRRQADCFSAAAMAEGVAAVYRHALAERSKEEGGRSRSSQSGGKQTSAW